MPNRDNQLILKIRSSLCSHKGMRVLWQSRELHLSILPSWLWVLLCNQDIISSGAKLLHSDPSAPDNPPPASAWGSCTTLPRFFKNDESVAFRLRPKSTTIITINAPYKYLQLPQPKAPLSNPSCHGFQFLQINSPTTWSWKETNKWVKLR